MGASILMLGGSLPGVETLKNLVLPGIGKIFIMDDKTVTKRDTGNNFFTPPGEEGKNRAEVLFEWLSEMNPWQFDKGT